MTTAERINELRQKIKHIKKTSKGGSDFRKFIRLQALLAYYCERYSVREAKAPLTLGNSQ